jgi:lipopolysaccharide/colanic/teichoic acid biosynthesis glycosyltransferase
VRAIEQGTGATVGAASALPQLFAVPTVREAAGYRFAKRLLDLVVSAAMMVVLSPLFLLVILAIRLDSPGPAIFSQQRVRGRRIRNVDGSHSWVTEAFTLHKFRTMSTGADDAIHRHYMAAYLRGDEGALGELRPDRKEGEHFRPANDPRVTRVGRLLRKTSLDELPQMWNVLKGDMSLVGPRPPMPYEVELYQERHLPRLAVTPGLTGLAQINGRAGIGFEDTVAWDIEYLHTRSLWLDLTVIVRTIPAVLSAKGAG